MPDAANTPAHADLGAYVLGRLDGVELQRFKAHLRDCARCRAEEAELRDVTRLLTDTRPAPLPASLEGRVLAAVGAAPDWTAGETHDDRAPAPVVSLASRRRGRWLAAGAAAAAGLAVAFVLGSSTVEPETRTVAQVRTVPDDRLPGETEVDTVLRGAGGEATALVNVVGPGRLVEVKSTAIPVIPKGTYYELWFVGPGDSAEKPNRISAGTWHPDSDGVTDVRFLIAADPKQFGRIEVTREPPDGDPSPSGDVQLTSG